MVTEDSKSTLRYHPEKADEFKASAVNDASTGSFYVLTTVLVVNERSAMMYRALLEGGADVLSLAMNLGMIETSSFTTSSNVDSHRSRL